jgi:hypothetical protein
MAFTKQGSKTHFVYFCVLFVVPYCLSNLEFPNVASLLLLPATCIHDLLSLRDFAKELWEIRSGRGWVLGQLKWQSNLAGWEIPFCVYFE